MNSLLFKKGPIAICTGGGDAPGLNAAIRASVLHNALHYGGEVIGIRNGFSGLMSAKVQVEKLSAKEVAEVHFLGGTILGAASQGSPLRDPKAAKVIFTQVKKNWLQLKPCGLIVAGGDGTQFMARQISELGIPIVGIPKTIDNDLEGSEVALGYSTAVEVAAHAAKSLLRTAAAHQRLLILEVMGRTSGFLALGAAVASGVDGVLVPEIPFSLEQLVTDLKTKSRVTQGPYKGSFRGMVLIVAEGAASNHQAVSRKTKLTASGQKVLGGIGEWLAGQIAPHLEVEVRVNVLGHLQRGADPNAYDRILASQLAVAAVDSIHAGKTGFIVTTGAQGFKTLPYKTLTENRRTLSMDDPLIRVARGLGMTLGDRVGS